jgi:ornithine cyclodeaminase/alanine dehydrogenase-like protein (mu-crystallin family)
VSAHGILYLSGREVARALEDIDIVSAATEALAAHVRGKTTLPDEAYLAWAGADGSAARSLSMPAALDGVVGVKIINGNLGNPDRGLPRASGLTLLFDPETALPRCVMEGAQISCLRTAAVTVIAAELLGRPGSESLALLGAGALGACHLRLLVRRPHGLREVRLFDVRGERSLALARTAPADGPQVVVAGSAEEAIHGSQLVVCVTTAMEGYIPFAWLEPGSLLVNVSLDDPLPEVMLRADKIFVDDGRLVAADSRRLLGQMLRDGLIAETDGELGDVLIGAVEGRSSAGEVIVMNPFGLAIEDLALARLVYERAGALALGTVLER